MSSPVANIVLVYLPIHHAAEEHRPFFPEPEPLKADSRRGQEKTRRVFVVDDEISIADSLVEILNDSGYDARALYSGNAAISLARYMCPDIVVADVVMPTLNGVETVLAIKQICPATRVVLFSGQASTSDILKRARADGHEFDLLPKPIHPDELLQRLADLK
jgi:CheY-like chemotaxis protein